VHDGHKRHKLKRSTVPGSPRYNAAQPLAPEQQRVFQNDIVCSGSTPATSKPTCINNLRQLDGAKQQGTGKSERENATDRRTYLRLK
jgi:hypothetical protein